LRKKNVNLCFCLQPLMYSLIVAPHFLSIFYRTTWSLSQTEAIGTKVENDNLRQALVWCWLLTHHDFWKSPNVTKKNRKYMFTKICAYIFENFPSEKSNFWLRKWRQWRMKVNWQKHTNTEREAKGFTRLKCRIFINSCIYRKYTQKLKIIICRRNRLKWW
jgi:hypothetical protein